MKNFALFSSTQHHFHILSCFERKSLIIDVDDNMIFHDLAWSFHPSTTLGIDVSLIIKNVS
jgi:hypothetical protein